MLNRTARRCVADATAFNGESNFYIYYNKTKFDTATSISGRFYTTNDVKDLVNQGKTNPVLPKRTLSHRTQPKANTMPTGLSFEELVKQRKEFVPSEESPRKPNPTRTRVTNRRLRPDEMELAWGEVSSQDANRQTPPTRTPKPRVPKRPTEVPSSMPKMDALGPAPVRSTSGGSRAGAFKKRGKRFGEEKQDEIAALNAEISEKDLEDEEFWDVDANAMRAFRKLTVWRNPVVGDEPGRPALFRSVKTGYDIFAEERTQFKLNDTTASWGGNRPTSSSQTEVGGPSGDYRVFLPETLKKVAGVDSTAMKPDELASLNLALSANLTPREREGAAAAVDEILSRAKGGQQK